MSAPTTHDPILHKERVAVIGTRWRLACPCGRAPARLLTPDEVNDEMRKHQSVTT
jgi:hypothetical protein